MKGFTRDNKFIPTTDYKKVTRKSRDQKIKNQGIKIERKAREGAKKSRENEIPESVLFRVISSKDIPFDIANKIWQRSISLRDQRNEQIDLQRKGKEAKFSVTDEELEEITAS